MSLSATPAAPALQMLLFGGLRLELSGFGGAATPTSDRSAPTAASVHCEVRRDPGLNDPEHNRDVTWRWDGSSGSLRTRNVRASLTRRADRRYSVRARLRNADADLDALLSALSAAVLEREGGVVLHAAAIEWRKRAVLFVGPSGAGKTTAGNHCAGALSFARDRVALVGSGAGFAAWPLPGGSSDGALLPSSNRSWLPLAGIVRVRRGRTMPHFERLAAAHALAVLRESALSSSGAAVEEGQLLASLADIVSATPVDALHTVLGEPLAEVIDEWLGEEAP